MVSAPKTMKLTSMILTMETRHNAWMKTPSKLMILLLLPFFGCKGVSHLPQSAVGD